MIKLPVQLAHDIFASAVTAFDIVHERNLRGEGSKLVEADRPIVGVIQPAGDKTIALVPEGARSDGAMVLHSADLTIVAADLTQTASTGRQTYVRHVGEVWKVWGLQDWNPHTAIRRYLMTKYVHADTVPAPVED